MNFLTDKIRPIYFKYLAAAFGSALITSIYGVVDAAMVGQYQGPTGTAALAVVAPVWNIIYSLGLLTGIGGSVLFGAAKGRQDAAKAKVFPNGGNGVNGGEGVGIGDVFLGFNAE